MAVLQELVAPEYGLREVASEVLHAALAPFEVLIVLMMVLILVAGYVVVLFMFGYLMERFVPRA